MGSMDDPPISNELRAVLARLLRPESVPTWLHRPATAWGGLTPAEMIRAGREDDLIAALESLDAGVIL
jgi:hypothetical protein